MLPLPALPARAAEVPRQGPVVLYCQSGVRSRQALELLRSLGYDNVRALRGGLEEW
ncbi:MAG: rhodanese-like domain-containing protein [Hymenobacter sp.]|nr:MAG: rhodanese-like domain-containing protein [Hymenobacter sp.]